MTDPMSIDKYSVDELLSAAMPQEAPTEVINAVTPWKKAMKLVLAGLILSIVGAESFPFDIPANTVGLVMMMLGFERLRKENRAFRICWFLSMAGLLICLVRIVLICFAVPFEMGRLKASLTLGHIMYALLILMILSLYYALRKVEAAAVMKIGSGWAWHVLAWYIVLRALILLYSIRNTGTVVIPHAFVHLVLIACTLALLIHALYKLIKELEEPGYAIQLCEPKFSGKTLALMLAAVVLVIYAAGHGPSEYRTNWQTAGPSKASSAQEMELKAAGLPEQLIAMMSEEDLRRITGPGASIQEIKGTENAAGSGNGAGNTNGAPQGSASDPAEDAPDVRTFFVENNGERYALYYFKFAPNAEFTGTNGLALNWQGGITIGDGSPEGHLVPDYIHGRLLCYVPVLVNTPADGTAADDGARITELFPREAVNPPYKSAFSAFELGDSMFVFQGFSAPKQQRSLSGGYVLAQKDTVNTTGLTGFSICIIKCKPGFKPFAVSAREYMYNYVSAFPYTGMHQANAMETTEVPYFWIYTYGVIKDTKDLISK